MEGLLQLVLVHFITHVVMEKEDEASNDLMEMALKDISGVSIDQSWIGQIYEVCPHLEK